MNIELKNNLEYIIHQRSQEKIIKNWEKCDEYRDYLDGHLIFIFDTNKGQDVYYMVEDSFKNNINMSKRKYVEYLIKRDIKANKNFDAWLFTINGGKK